MSLLNFPPPSVQECTYSQQEYEAKIIALTREQAVAQNNEIEKIYPRLSNPQHILSRDDVNVVRSQSCVRCVAVDGRGGRVAVCQSTDYIQIYGIDPDAYCTCVAQQPPLTLHHAQMKNVAAMHFDFFSPLDARVLAVAAGANVLFWRLSFGDRRFVGTMSKRASGQCIRVVETGVSPLSSLVCDSSRGNSAIVASCTTNKIIVADLEAGDHSSVDAPFEGGVTGLYPSRRGTRLAVTFTTNALRIYDRSLCTNEKWGGLAGRATGVVWSPTEESLIFSTEEAATLIALSFSKNARIGEVKTIAAMSIFDLSPLPFNPFKNATNEMLDHWTLRAAAQIGGPVRSMACSEDGRRLALTFTTQECSGFIAVFSVVWGPSTSRPVTMYPIGFVESASSGTPECVFFLPNSAGSMLAISWSSGSVQYVPLIYRNFGGEESMEHPIALINRWDDTVYVDYGSQWQKFA